MMYKFLLQCSTDCCKCIPTENCDWGNFLLKCVCNFGKPLVVVLFGLLTIGIIVIACISLIWGVRRFYIWYKRSIKPNFKKLECISCFENLREIDRKVCNICGANMEEKPDTCVLISLEGLLKRMESAVQKYNSANTSNKDKNLEMIDYQNKLSCIKVIQHKIECIFNVRITSFVKDLSDCLDDMVNNKSGKDLQDKFKKAKDGIEKLLS